MRDFDWEVLASLYRTGNITRSAEELFISQPALSKRIMAIEQELGCQLVIRSTRGIVFTPVGKRVLTRTQQLIETMKDIRQDIEAFSSGESGTLFLGCPYSYSRYALPAMLEEYVRLYPNIHVNVTSGLSDQLVQRVLDGTLDLCFARYNLEDDMLQKRLISEDCSYAVCGSPFKIEDLPQIPYIDFSKNAGTIAATEKWWNETFSTPLKAHYTVSTADTCLPMIEHGIGFGIFPDTYWFAHDQQFYALPLQFKDGTYFTRKTWLIYRTGADVAPMISNFIRYVESTRESQQWLKKPVLK